MSIGTILVRGPELAFIEELASRQWSVRVEPYAEVQPVTPVEMRILYGVQRTYVLSKCPYAEKRELTSIEEQSRPKTLPLAQHPYFAITTLETPYILVDRLLAVSSSDPTHTITELSSGVDKTVKSWLFFMSLKTWLTLGVSLSCLCIIPFVPATSLLVVGAAAMAKTALTMLTLLTILRLRQLSTVKKYLSPMTNVGEVVGQIRRGAYVRPELLQQYPHISQFLRPEEQTYLQQLS